jgi:hypothetical protein
VAVSVEASVVQALAADFAVLVSAEVIEVSDFGPLQSAATVFVAHASDGVALDTLAGMA